jgi:hypothetical protein
MCVVNAPFADAMLRKLSVPFELMAYALTCPARSWRSCEGLLLACFLNSGTSLRGN